MDKLILDCFLDVMKVQMSAKVGSGVVCQSVILRPSSSSSSFLHHGLQTIVHPCFVDVHQGLPETVQCGLGTLRVLLQEVASGVA